MALGSTQRLTEMSTGSISFKELEVWGESVDQQTERWFKGCTHTVEGYASVCGRASQTCDAVTNLYPRQALQF